MDAPIIKLFGLVVVLFGVLIAFTSRWAVFEAEELRDQPLNRRELLEDARVERGLIRAADGTVLARSVPSQLDTFRRRYPEGRLFPHAIGYSFTNLGRSGLEQFRNDDLTGERNEIRSAVEELLGKDREGDDVLTTLDPKGQQAAYDALEGRKGSVVAIEPKTGAVKVLASVPQFDSNEVDTSFSRLSRDTDNSPLFNRATQSGYPPGSTMKVMTAIAALDSGEYEPTSVVNGDSGKRISGVPLPNSGGSDFGNIDLTTALTFSVNTVWAEVAEKLGKETMGKYMKRLGFYAKPPLDYPSGQRRASGAFFNGRLLDPLDDRIDIGRLGIGQDKLNVTPLQMAMVVAAIANKGRLMRPHMTDKIVDPDGRTEDGIDDEAFSTVMKEETAAQLTEMMANVVREGTGTAAALSGVAVAGKTGTAERNVQTRLNQPWFICFAPVEDPRIAVAVTVESSIGGQGGTVAAPVAKQVLEALL